MGGERLVAHDGNSRREAALDIPALEPGAGEG
jgi:hypothetical protein